MSSVTSTERSAYKLASEFHGPYGYARAARYPAALDRIGGPSIPRAVRIREQIRRSTEALLELGATVLHFVAEHRCIHGRQLGMRARVRANRHAGIPQLEHLIPIHI